MKKTIFVSLVIALLLLTACSSPEAEAPQDLPDVTSPDKVFCTTDNDCVCGGIDRVSGGCFLGNKDYYEKNVDKLKQCPDFCAGIAGNLVVRCIDSKCMQVMECLTDLDCDSGVCKGNKCVEDAQDNE